MSSVRTLEQLAVGWGLPDDFGVEVLETQFIKYFSERPGEYLVREHGGMLLWDERALLLLERDLHEAYAARMKRRTGRDLTRILRSSDAGFQVRQYCLSHELPVCTRASVGSPVTHVGILEALRFDLRLAAKYADDDVRVLNAPRDRGLLARFFLAGAVIVGAFVGSYFGVSLAVRNGLERARGELDDYVFPRFQQELRSGIDANVQRYVGSFVTGNSSPDSASPKPRKLPED